MKINLVCFPMVDWKQSEKYGFRTRDAHLYHSFSLDERIHKLLVINRPLSISEKIIRQQHWPTNDGNLYYKNKNIVIKQINDKTYVLDVLSYSVFRPVFQQRNWIPNFYKRNEFQKTINHSLLLLGINDFVHFSWNPLHYHLYKNIGEKIFVFDSLDNWLEHPNMIKSKVHIQRGYNIINDKADVVFVNAKKNLNLFPSVINKLYVSNGVDFNRFQTPHPCPEDLSTINGIRVAYIGKIGTRLDSELMSHLIESRPNYNFIFIGPIYEKKSVHNFYKAPNTFFLGDKHYNILPSYLNNIDICILPHKVGGFDADHIKLYEYLSANKPVITTAAIGVMKFKDHIKISANKNDFLNNLDESIDSLNTFSGYSRDLIEKLQNEYSWKTKSLQMIDIIQQKMLS